MTNRCVYRKSTKTINNRNIIGFDSMFESDRSIKTLNRNIFRSININFYRKKFVIKNKLPILYTSGKWMHYPESPKVSTHTHH